MINTQQELNKELSKIWDQYGAFFAFSSKQFKENMKEGIEYKNTGAGLICPVDNVQPMESAMESAINEFQANDLKNTGREKLIWRELANYESQITMDPRNAIEALESYGITEKEVMKQWPAYMQYCRENDLF